MDSYANSKLDHYLVLYYSIPLLSHPIIFISELDFHVVLYHLIGLADRALHLSSAVSTLGYLANGVVGDHVATVQNYIFLLRPEYLLVDRTEKVRVVFMFLACFYREWQHCREVLAFWQILQLLNELLTIFETDFEALSNRIG